MTRGDQVPLDLFSDQARLQGLSEKIWHPFLDHIDNTYAAIMEVDPHTEIEHAHVCEQELAAWGGHTDWDEERGPIWFKDEQTMIAFVLAWSK